MLELTDLSRGLGSVSRIGEETEPKSTGESASCTLEWTGSSRRLSSVSKVGDALSIDKASTGVGVTGVSDGTRNLEGPGSEAGTGLTG